MTSKLFDLLWTSIKNNSELGEHFISQFQINADPPELTSPKVIHATEQIIRDVGTGYVQESYDRGYSKGSREAYLNGYNDAEKKFEQIIADLNKKIATYEK